MSRTALACYYTQQYPCEEIHAMLAMGSEASASRREVSLQFPGNSNVYAQKQLSRNTPGELRHSMQFQCAESLHMGQMLPEEALYSGLEPRKELVFDIDCTDYTRFCECEGQKRFCAFCWRLHITGTILILRHFLCRRLGIDERHLLWVFSGGKGIHCFVNARAYLPLGDPERTRLFRLMQCAKDDWTRLVELTVQLATQHPDFMEQLEEHFVKNVLRQCDALCNTKLRDYLVHLLGREFPLIYINTMKAWAQYEAGDRIARADPNEPPPNESEQRWCLMQRVEMNVSGFDPRQPRASQCLMLRLMWPMLDAGPLALNHRIKLPFSIHSSQRVALPMSAEQLLEMNVARDTVTFQELQLSRVTPRLFTRGVELLREWVTQYGK